MPFLLTAEALAQAEAADRRQAAGQALSPIDGLPMTLKDAVRLRGAPSTYGMWSLRRYRPRTDSSAVAALRDAGIVFLGRTAVPTAALDWNCRNYLYKECRNPLDLSRTPGGSSGGAAAALVRGFTPLELGSDLGGSIRYPAHCCGIYGLRTTEGWLPVRDLGPERFSVPDLQLVTVGPMARSAKDLELLLSVFARAFPRPELARIPFPPSGLKILYSFELLGLGADRSTRIRLEELLSRLAARGHDVREGKPDVDFEELFRIWGTIAGYEFGRYVPKLLRNGLIKRAYAWWILNRLGPGPFSSYFRAGILATTREYEAACRLRQERLIEVDRGFATNAAWVLPVAPSAALRLSQAGKPIVTPEGVVPYSRYLGTYTVPTTVLGTPALTVPMGVDADGLPLGAQIHGPRFADLWLVRTLAPELLAEPLSPRLQATSAR